ncbi:MAG: hypothetical protein RL030_1745 [Pseudomonadota bacterium]|jgi:hypothetical protein
MDMHGQIMNLGAKPPKNWDVKAWVDAFKSGHTQARHAAAELALEADRRIDLLAEALVDMTAGMKDHDIAAHTGMNHGDCERLAEVRAWALAHQRRSAVLVSG